MLKGKHIVVGISGGIAAYKIPELIRLLIKEGAEVRVTTTRNALQFVTETTLRTLSGYPVYSDVFAAVNAHATEHISLPDWADLMLIAPATANTIAKMAHGIADDALTTTYAACIARKPVVIAPAMNDKMYANPATQLSFSLLVGQGVHLLDCAAGFLACGTEGKGRMQEIETILEAVQTALTPQSLAGRHILLTAGPTRERIDPVRYVSNDSSGKMGYALARECLRRGARVTLISGPTNLSIFAVPFLTRKEDTSSLIPNMHALSVNNQLTLIPVESAQMMYDAAKKVFLDDSDGGIYRPDATILSAAVADFTPAEPANQKRKKQPGQTEMQLRMVLTPDIAATLGKQKGLIKSSATEQNGGIGQPQRLIGFALETENEEQNAYRKLESKNLDMIVLNSLRDEGAGFGVDTNKVTLITRAAKENLPLLSKQEVASRIVDAIESNFFS